MACGVLEPVPFSDWAAPVVPIVKQDGRIRICGDFKLTINQVAHVETYPLPCIEDLLASLGKGKLFSKLDLADAYLQLALEEDSKLFQHTKASTILIGFRLVSPLHLPSSSGP